MPASNGGVVCCWQHPVGARRQRLLVCCVVLCCDSCPYCWPCAGVVITNSSSDSISERSLTQKREYCERHGYTLHVFDNSIAAPRHVYLGSTLAVMAVLRLYDWVFKVSGQRWWLAGWLTGWAAGPSWPGWRQAAGGGREAGWRLGFHTHWCPMLVAAALAACLLDCRLI